MKLHFHGSSYESNLAELQVSEGKVGGKYRGSFWKVHRLKEQKRRHNRTSLLTYRGVSYTKN